MGNSHSLDTNEESMPFSDLGLITFYWVGFTAAQRERAQEDVKVL